MQNNVCNKCRKRKSIDDFSWRNKTANKKLETCKQCYNEYRRKYYDEHKQEEKQKVNTRRVKIRNELIDKLVNYLKRHPCVDCGEKDPVVLHFDHIRDKTTKVSWMLRDLYSWEKIIKEIQKCEVRCANCHMRKTARDFNWRKLRIS